MFREVSHRRVRCIAGLETVQDGLRDDLRDYLSKSRIVSLRKDPRQRYPRSHIELQVAVLINPTVPHTFVGPLGLFAAGWAEPL